MPAALRWACAALLLLHACAPATAWWDTGHMVVAQIALDALSMEDQHLLSLAVRFLGPVTGPRSDTFVESACWQDDVRENKLHLMEPWHFIDIPYNPEDIPISVPDPFRFGNNAVEAITKLRPTARQCDAAEGSCTGRGAFEVSFAVRTLAHVVGDLHQPLHAASMFSTRHPDGDMGGNLCRIVTPEGAATEMHAFWDSGAGLFPEEAMVRPLAPASWAVVRRLAREIAAAHPASSFALKPRNATAWAEESYAAAVGVVYNGTCRSDVTQLTAGYQEAARKVVGRRIAAAGYRLAATLRDFPGMPDPGPASPRPVPLWLSHLWALSVGCVGGGAAVAAVHHRRRRQQGDGGVVEPLLGAEG